MINDPKSGFTIKRRQQEGKSEIIDLSSSVGEKFKLLDDNATDSFNFKSLHRSGPLYGSMSSGGYREDHKNAESYLTTSGDTEK